MPGRPAKPRPSLNRERLVGKLLSDVGNFQSRTAREVAEERLGRPLTDHEWLAISMTERKPAG